MFNPDDVQDLCCPICFSVYAEREIIPRMLKCGHTHCHQCLLNVIRIGFPKCGECRKPIDFRDPKHIPVNYSILRLKEVMKSDGVVFQEFGDVDRTLDMMAHTLDKTKELHNEKAKEFMDKLDIAKQKKEEFSTLRTKLKRASTNFEYLTPEKQTLSDIENLLLRVKDMEIQNKIFSKILERGEQRDILQAIYEYPSGVAISYMDIMTMCFISQKKIYMNSFDSSFKERMKFMIDYSQLHPFMTGIFMILEYEKRQIQLEFELFEHCSRGNEILRLCFGDMDMSYQEATVSKHTRIGMEGESAVFGFAEGCIKSRAINVDFKKSGSSTYIKKGYIEGLGNDRATGTHFRIYFEDWPCRRSPFCFGKLTRGGSILRSVLKNGYDTKITRCGIIFDPSI